MALLELKRGDVSHLCDTKQAAVFQGDTSGVALYFRQLAHDFFCHYVEMGVCSEQDCEFFQSEEYLTSADMRVPLEPGPGDVETTGIPGFIVDLQMWMFTGRTARHGPLTTNLLSLYEHYPCSWNVLRMSVQQSWLVHKNFASFSMKTRNLKDNASGYTLETWIRRDPVLHVGRVLMTQGQDAKPLELETFLKTRSAIQQNSIRSQLTKPLWPL